MEFKPQGKAQKKNDVKARSMLLMALPNEHQLTFNQYKDAKTLFDAIQTRFGGNDATRKTQKTLLKRLVWRNKSDLDTMSIDDLYNNFKIVEQEKVNTTNVQVSTPNCPVSTADTLDSTANLNDLEEMDLKWQLALLSMRAKKVFPENWSYESRPPPSSRRTCECGRKLLQTMVAIVEAGFDWSFMADEEVPTNMALMAFSDS
ncbi:hypothetical protein Tco_0725862 [Tanacetum coccineum]|uniref:Uncharacterized protein n=1 Tax=Tanacetum coccineum TaxID=301880 RepID=A0ABQ4YEY0_9ASTR